MNTLKTLCVAVVLSTVGYGAFVTFTAKPPAAPPIEAKDWGAAPLVQLPGAGSSAPAALSSPPSFSSAGPSAQPSSPPPFGSAPPPTSSSAPAFDAANNLASTVASTSSGTSSPPSTPAADPFLNPSGVSPSSTATTAPGSVSPPSGVYTPNNPTSAPSFPPAPTTPPVDVNPTPLSPTASTTTGPTASTTTGPTASPTGIAPAPLQTDPYARFAESMQSCQTMLNQGRLAESLLALTEWFDNPNTPQDERPQLVDLLDRLAVTVIYSRQHLLEPPYIVRPGDTLEQIADRYQVPPALLAKINGIVDPRQVQSGVELKVLRGPFNALVNLKTQELTLLLHGRYAGRFPFTVGQDAATPEGEYSVQDKAANPQYVGPGGLIDADDPNNPLGEHLLILENHVKIHGSPARVDPTNVDPRGSVRLSALDVGDVFDMLTKGSRVTIRR